ncbi:DUF3298 domain-containing protein [Acidithrix sp. C25]|nr:DUF3298 domain-containing protein [Acidithrix sp. C25]
MTQLVSFRVITPRRVLFVPLAMSIGALIGACGSTTSLAAVAKTTTTAASASPTLVASPLSPTGSTSTTLPSTTTTSPSVVPTQVSQTYSKSGSSPSFSVNISYPVISGMTSSSAQNGINSQIYGAVASWANSFMQNVAMAASSGSGPNGVSNLTGSYKVTLLDARLASFQFVLNTAAAAASAPNTSIQALTFSLASGTVLSLSDLFGTNNSFLTTLSNQARAQLTTQLAAQGVPSAQIQSAPGLNPLLSNFAAFNITSNSLILGFSQGQVISSAIGDLTVNIPLVDLKSIIDPTGPLANP